MSATLNTEGAVYPKPIQFTREAITDPTDTTIYTIKEAIFFTVEADFNINRPNQSIVFIVVGQ
jgi:hypothetical protein